MSPWGCGGLFTVGVWPGMGPRLGRACPGAVCFSFAGGCVRGIEEGSWKYQFLVIELFVGILWI